MKKPISIHIIIVTATACLLCISCPGQTRINGEIRLGGGTREPGINTTPGADIPLRIDSNCVYLQIEGTALITGAKWIEAQPGKDSSQASVEIVFSFTPADPAKKAGYRFPAIKDENQKSTLLISAGLLARAGNDLAPGTKVNCTRNEISSGTCTPVVYSFPDFQFKQ